ncbi:MAG: hypothetical protein ACHRHE_09070 [Tepidisphaerales bacterium]
MRLVRQEDVEPFSRRMAEYKTELTAAVDPAEALTELARRPR